MTLCELANSTQGGFVIYSSRFSYEIMQWAVLGYQHPTLSLPQCLQFLMTTQSNPRGQNHILLRAVASCRICKRKMNRGNEAAVLPYEALLVRTSTFYLDRIFSIHSLDQIQGPK